MTVNAFLMSWDCTGVEAIIPITQYEDWDTQCAFELLQGNTPNKTNPLNSIYNSILLRARFNNQRFYEVYAVDCDPGITEQDWRDMWEASPQMCADMIRKRGVKLYGEGMGKQKTVIV
jgi:hypothetical protein